MKTRLIIILAIFNLVHIACAEDPQNVSVGTNVVCLAPSRLQSQAVPSKWLTSTAYSQGDLVIYGADFAETATGTITDGQVYMAASSGTSSTNAPVHTNGETSDGTVTWRHITTGANLKPVPRVSVDVVSLSSNYVYIGTSPNITTSKGIPLTSIGSSYFNNKTQLAIYAIAASASNSVRVQECVE